ncbi:HYR domain-containing protein [Archangium violaceum]|uniref:HYR domain-containing protein n=1 Tax=Archangium violaceum TaxID=83451 RepID=UPI002B2A830C|nr:HYR domain-containing protein [Archangium violaceum]
MSQHPVKFLLAALAAFFVTACSPTPPAAEAPAPEAPAQQVPAPGVSAPFDVQDVIRRVTRAFRVEQGRFTSDQRTYAVHVGQEGTLRFTARHWMQPSEGSTPGTLLTAGALEVRTASVSRAGRLLSRAARAEVREDGALSLDGGAVVEVLENAEGGLEQRWELAEKPQGTGDLEVRVELAGLPYVGETEGGHHYADPATGLGVRYGQATWVDARGVRTAVKTVHEDGALRIRVPEAVLEASSWPAVLDPLISPEIRPDTPVSAPTENQEASPVTAYTEGTFLVVWDVLRGSQRDIVATRVRASDGVVLDPAGIVLASSDVEESYPIVAAQGDLFLVAWKQLSDGLYRTRVRGSDGQVLDATPVRISSSSPRTHSAAAACNAGACAVAWSETWTGILGTRIRLSDGKELGTSLISGETAPAVGDLAVGADETQFLVAWSVEITGGARNHDIHGARFLASNGAVLDSSPLLISTAYDSQTLPAITFAGGTFFVAWVDYRTSTSSGVGIYGTRVRAADGAVLDPAGILIAAPSQKPWDVSLGTDGSQFLAVWQSMGSASLYEVRGARVSSAGVLLDSSALVFVKSTTSEAQSPGVAFDGSHFLLVWMRRESSTRQQNIYGSRVRASDLVMLEPAGTLLSTRLNSQRNPAVAQGGGKYLVVWSDSRTPANGDDIYGVRVGADGELLDSAAIPIATVATSHQRNPQVAFDGSNFLVVWSVDGGSSYVGIQGARVRGADGVVLDPTGIAISGYQNNLSVPRLAFGEGHYFVVWSDKRNYTDSNVYGVRLRASDGKVVESTALAVSSAAGEQFGPVASFGAGSFFVVWVDERTSRDDIYGARVRASDGVVLDAAGIPLSTAATFKYAPDVAFDGNNFLTVWRDNRSGNADFYGTRVLASTGQVLDPTGLALCVEPNAQTNPTLIFDGKNYLLVWADTRSGVARINGSRVKPDGTVLDGTGFLIAAEASYSKPVVAASAPGRYLVADDPHDAANRTNRLKLRRVVSVSEGESCTSGEECSTGYCVEGVCCSSACEGGTCGSGTCEYPPLAITCPATVEAEATSAEGAPVSYPPATAVGTPPLSVTYSQGSETGFPLGNTSVTATATDGTGLTRSCDFTVTVRDTTAPTLVCPEALTVDATSPQGATVTYAPAVADDAVSTVTLDYSQASGSHFDVGATTVSVSATDAAGNTARCSFPVTVHLPPAPRVSCPAALEAEATSADGALVSYPPATASGTEPLSVTYSQGSGTGFSLGTTSVTATVTDGLGRTSACAFTVTVRDTTAPTLVCPEALTVDATSLSGATVTYAPATADDAVSAVTLDYSQTSGSHFDVGTTIVSVSATDAAGNTARCSFPVTVNLPPEPVIHCPEDVVVEATRADGNHVDFQPVSVLGTRPLSLTYSHDTEQGFPLGTTSVTVTVVDGLGRDDSCVFTITVRDTTAPVISCPADVQVEDAPEQGLVVDYPAATASDTVSLPVLSYSPAPGTLFPVGTTQVTATATDSSGNSATCSFQVRVSPHVPVVVPAPPAGGCGCSTGLGTPAGLGWMALLLLLTRGAARRRHMPS